jgi:hypothetical protein
MDDYADKLYRAQIHPGSDAERWKARPQPKLSWVVYPLNEFIEFPVVDIPAFGNTHIVTFGPARLSNSTLGTTSMM